MKNLKAKFITFNQNESGATMIEYALIAALISVVAISAMSNVGTQVTGQFENIESALGGTVDVDIPLMQ